MAIQFIMELFSDILVKNKKKKKELIITRGDEYANRLPVPLLVSLTEMKAKKAFVKTVIIYMKISKYLECIVCLLGYNFAYLASKYNPKNDSGEDPL